MPGPPEQLHPHDVKREIQEQVGQGDHERFHPQAQFESHGNHTGGVVETRVCELGGLGGREGEGSISSEPLQQHREIPNAI